MSSVSTSTLYIGTNWPDNHCVKLLPVSGMLSVSLAILVLCASIRLLPVSCEFLPVYWNNFGQMNTVRCVVSKLPAYCQSIALCACQSIDSVLVFCHYIALSVLQNHLRKKVIFFYHNKTGQQLNKL